MRSSALIPAFVLLFPVGACAPQGPKDDPVMQPPGGTEPETQAADDPAEAEGTAQGELPAAGWTRRSGAPVALSEVASAPFGGSVWTAGGLDGEGRAVDSVLVYDPTFDAWEEGPALPEPLHHAALVSTGSALHLIGGYVGSGFDQPTDAVLVLDAATGEWAAGPVLPAARAAGAAAWDGARVVYGGGVGSAGLAGDVWALDGGRWRPLGALSEGREHLAGASDGAGRVWFLGGRTGGLDSNLTTVDLVEGEAVTGIGELTVARGGAAGVHLPGIGACAIGGEGLEGTFDAVECLDGGGAVTALPGLGEPRHGLGAAVVEGVAYAVLGGPEPGLSVSTVIEGLDLGP